MANLSTFMGKIRDSGITKQNRYSVAITGPAGLASYDVNMMCESVSFPGQNLRTTTDDVRQGPTREIAHGVIYAPINLRFISTSGQPERKFFEDWQEMVFDRDSWQVNYYDTYVGSMILRSLDSADGAPYSVYIYEAWPKTIGPQEFSYASNNAYQTVSVEFAYRSWDSIAVSGGPSGPPGRDNPYVPATPKSAPMAGADRHPPAGQVTTVVPGMAGVDRHPPMTSTPAPAPNYDNRAK